MRKLILSAGRDAYLLKKRNDALVEAGYIVVSASSSYEAMERLLNGDFDLVLLCHSLSNEERRRLSGIVKNYSPSTPVVLIADMEGQHYEYATRTVRCYPEQILAAVKTMLEVPQSSAA
jgi:DNA-binding NtrC family response regulator